MPALKIYTGSNKALVGLCVLLEFKMKTPVHRLPISKVPTPKAKSHDHKNAIAA